MKCAFTGHRPEKLPFGNNEWHPACCQLKKELFCEMLRLTRDGVTVFITGMCTGVDLWAAEEVLKIKAAKPSQKIELWSIIPYDRQAAAWSKAEQERYQRILEQADYVEYTAHEYYRGCLQKRNRRMIELASHLIAVYDGLPGGTQTTIDYARRKGLDITIIEPKKEGIINGTVH